ncbi:MAG TPA: DUF2117 domain-containing protein [Methanomicrobia archaeon]|nr:DUF2117 domain-containing protein [Methanomicrobia archaeon]HEX58548.1 DUF2117 domain-containing protein [Methanomicrobia archaeon]
MKRLGLVFHGPEVIDSGEAVLLLEAFSDFEVRAALGGITGKTAVIDAGLQHIIDISMDLRPSEVVRRLYEEGADLIIFANHAKTLESGISLGAEVLKRANVPKFVQVEFQGRRLIPWRAETGELEAILRILKPLGFELASAVLPAGGVISEGGLEYRRVHGVLPNEKIIVNGVVIGISNSDDVVIVAKDGKIVELQGGTLITHNLVKLGKIDLRRAMVKSARVFRRTTPSRISEKKMRKEIHRIAYFYNAEHVFSKIGDVDAAVTVGDDTTCIIGDIFRRFGMPIIGITDGDADCLVEGYDGSLESLKKFLPSGSFVLRLEPESDDIIGERVKTEVFNGRDEIKASFEEVKRKVVKIASGRIKAVLET